MKKEISGTRRIGTRTKDLKIDNLKNINVLFGKNGTGKSTFMRNLYQSDSESYHLIVPERGGSGMKYQSGFLDQENDPRQKKRARQNNFDQNYKDRAFSRAAGILMSQGFKSMHNKTMDISAADVSELFGTFLPEFNVRFNDRPFNLEVYTEDKNGNEKNVIDATELSSGQAEALSLAADIVTQGVMWNDSDGVLLIDEPDAHLHTDLENRFSIFINEISKRFGLQIFIATHSSGLIASLLNLSEDIGVVCFDEKSEEISAVRKDQNQIFTNLLSVELALAVVLDRKIVIVEGNDDFLVWNQATRAPSFEDISLIQASGNDILKYKRNAERILNAAVDNTDQQLGITVLDGDGKNEFQNNPGDILPCERLKCYSLENLFLTDEVLKKVKEGINLDEELLSLKEKENISQEEKEKIDEIIDDKKQTQIPKNLIKKVHDHVDDYSTTRDWRIVVGKTIGENKPTGELKNFLGNELVNYIWSL